MKIFLTIAAIMSLVIVSFVMAAGEEASSGAILTVNEFLDITIGGVTPIDFGANDPGTSDNQAGGTVTITIQSTTNVVTDTFLKGNDWTSPVTLAISNVKYGNGTSANFTMANDYAAANNGYFENVACPCGVGTTVLSLDFWLTVPPGQQAGEYTNTSIFFKTVTNGVSP